MNEFISSLEQFSLSFSADKAKKKNTCVYGHPTDPNLFFQQLFDTNFCQRPYLFLHRIRITIFVV